MARLRLLELELDGYRAKPDWRAEEVASLPMAEDSEAREASRVRDNCCEIIDMEDWREGLAKRGDRSPDIVLLDDARRRGLALGCRDEFRRGEPTWPKTEPVGAWLFSSSRFCRAKSAPNREGLAVPGEPTLLDDSAGVPKPLELSRRTPGSCSVLDSRRVFSCGVSRS